MSFRIVYNNLTIEYGTDYTVEEITGLWNIPLRINRDDKTGKDGGLFYSAKYGARTISFNGKIKSSTSSGLNNAIRAFTAAFSKNISTLPLKIRLSDNTEKTIYAYVSSMPEIVLTVKEMGSFVAIYRVSLVCEDPFFIDVATYSDSVGLIQLGGFSIPTTIPISSPSSSGGTLTINNTGDVEVYPKLTITGALNCQNPTIKNSTTGEQVQFLGTLIASDILIIQNTQSGLEVTLNGSNALQYLSGDLFSLVVGNNTIVFSASAYTTANLQVEANFKYLTIE